MILAQVVVLHKQMQHRGQTIIRGIPVGVPDSTNVLSHCVENVYQAAVQGSEQKKKKKEKNQTVVHMLAVLLAAIELLVLL